MFSAMTRRREHLLIVASLLLALSAPAVAQTVAPVEQEPEAPMFRLQGEIAFQTTNNGFLSISYLFPLARLGDSRWRAFAGVGGIGVWPGEDREGTRTGGVGAELRLGLVHGGKAGSPRIALRLAPMYVESSFADDRRDRGVGVRAAVSVSWPTWLLGRIPGDWDQGETAFVGFWFALVPTTIEYAFQIAPGDVSEGHTLAIGWGF
jgi:hypothetical protein